MVHINDIGSRLDFTNSNAHRKQTIASMDNANYPAVISIHLTIMFKAK
jgi:hypothetical protein